MKKLILLALMLFSVEAYSQGALRANMTTAVGSRARLEKTYTNFTATSDDTSGYFTIDVPGWTSDPLFCSQVVLLGVATDSVAADVNVIGRNGSLTSDITVSYADSIVGTSNTSNTSTIILRNSTTNRLNGCTQFKVGTVFRATGQGTTTGRTMKWYLLYVFP